MSWSGKRALFTPDERKLRKSVQAQRSNFAVKRKVFVHYCGASPECLDCHHPDLRVLELHHRHGGGAEHRRQVFGDATVGGSRFYKWLVKCGFPEIDFDALCSNCHLLRRYTPNWLEITR